VIKKYLNRNAVSTWKRPDILGLVTASYATLLQSSEVITAQDSSSVTDNYALDLRQSFRDCMVMPFELKSFSFARHSLIPALRMPDPITHDYASVVFDSTCNSIEFFLATLAEFASRFLDLIATSGHHPISREKWEQDAENELKLRREQREQEQRLRGHFPKWSDPVNAEDTANDIPSYVDLIARPDCVDDVFAFSTSIGVLGPDYALHFWSQESSTVEEDSSITKLVPSQALAWLRHQQRDDESLRPVYLSFLSALALAKNPSNHVGGSGADAVFALISLEGAVFLSGWSAMFELFRWYIRQLSPDISTTRTSSISGSSGGASTAYYYLEGDDSGVTDFAYGSQERSKSDDVVLQSQPRELGEANEFVLLSNLAVIANVASLSATARATISSIYLPIIEADGETVGQQSVVAVLYTLSVMPLTPDVRGTVFHTISKLLSVEGLINEAVDEMRNSAEKGWGLLEECQIIPINVLQQFQTMHDPTFSGAASISFPPSSSALVRYHVFF
jgi:hypothetical protein